MSANFNNMGEVLKFQQRWEFRRGDSDFDSSSNDSKSSLGSEPAHKKHRLALVPVDNEETTDTVKFQKKGNKDPSVSGHTELGKPEKVKRERSKNVRSSLARNGKKGGTRKEPAAWTNKGKTSVDEIENAALDDLKKYMNSLLEELKITRKNLLSWMKEEMQKLVEEEKATETERQEGGSSRLEADQLEYQKTCKKTACPPCQNLSGKNFNVQHQNSFEEYGQLQQQRKLEKNVQMQQIINLEENIEEQPQKNSHEKVQSQQGIRTKTRTGTLNSNGGLLKRYNRRKKSAVTITNNHSPVLEDKVDYSHAIVLLTPSEGDGEEKLAVSGKSNSKSRASESNVQAKSIVLGIKAQNSNGGSKPARGKRAANSNTESQVPNYQVNYSQGIGSIAPTEKEKEERSGLTIEPSFPSNPFNKIPSSSMYLTLPTVLANSQIHNHRPETSSFSYIQPRIPQNQAAGMNAERSNPILGSSSYLGYYQSMLQQTEERSRNYSQMSPRDISFLNQNNTTTSQLGNGFTVPLQAVSGGFNMPNQFDLESLHRENTNSLGLSTNGAFGFPSGSFSFSEPYIPNNFHRFSNYRPDGRLMTYQDSRRYAK